MKLITCYYFYLEKARLIENQGAKGGIVIDSNPGTTANGNPLFAMSGDGTDDVSQKLILKFDLR